ncbi:MAG TPA: ATP-grasp domain-containing protein [Patescibacteria group bacterium]|jgi:ribosomal protein S6--L-glutamate ligase|nr:ATP-grasp domain-containing protein [Patescibacteria group bacterium]
MKRILVLFSRKSHEQGLTDPERLVGLLNQTDTAQFEYAYFDELSFYVDEQTLVVRNERSDRVLDEYSALYLRHWGGEETQSYALAVARYCRLKRIAFIDSEAWRVGSFNKLTQYINLHEVGVAMPRTVMAQGEYLLSSIKRHGFDYPMILKATKGTRGADNYKIASEDELTQVVSAQPQTSFVAQQFIENSGDYRILVAGNQVVMAIKRIARDGSHLNNTSQGGSAMLVDVDSLPEQLRADSVKAAQFFGRDFAGVDMVIDDVSHKHYCFEVNRAPQIEGSSYESEKALVLAQFLTTLDASA